MSKRFLNTVSAVGFIGILALTYPAGPALAQDADNFDASVETLAAIEITCGQDLSFGLAYVGAANQAATITLTDAGATSSSHASVAVSGGAAGQCTISGLDGLDTANLTLSGGGGVAAPGGLTGVALESGAFADLIATIQVTGGANISGGKSGLANGVIPFSGTLAIPAGHTDFAVYSATLTATVSVD